eukprot:CAMPEP_0119370810 /NCGR_PEP_ID=MMETSP1334-20130426/17111_1 /TAXON_ID=127549 /ORGANISM="Calcidiscus leptoporus, Strain RCC1130" /LENGTH=192 /DNA_ID=CAMNT_0007387951 /DNA_START=96 /DNA_END=674 /DNA_ORIENTATION=+
MQREVSYLSDLHSAPKDPSAVPDSLIPEAFRILLEAPLPHELPLFGMGEAAQGWLYNPVSRQWELPIFPSKVPSGRRDVVLLHSWVNDMVNRLKLSAGSLPEEEVFKEAQLLFSVAFHEMIRQVSTHCLERGHLMGKIWWSEMELFQRVLQLRKSEEEARELERMAFKTERDALRRQVADLEEQLRNARSSH